MDQLDTPDAIDTLLLRIGRETVGDIDANEIFACNARDAALRLAYVRGELAAVLALVQIDIYRGRLDGALASLGAAEMRLEQHGTAADRLFAGTLGATIAFRQGQPQEAIKAFETLQSLADILEPCAELVVYLNRRGQCADSTGNPEIALRCMFEALAVAERIESPALQANMLSNLGSGQHDAGNIDDAIDLLNDALALIDRFGLESMRSVAACNLAMCRLASNEIDEAWTLLTTLIEKPIIGEDPETYAFVRLLAAEALIRRGNLSLAERFVSYGLKVGRDIGSSTEIMHGEWLHGLMDLERNNVPAAAAHLAKAHALEHSGAPMLYRSQLHLALARCAAAGGDWQNAHEALMRHLDLQTTMRAAAHKSRMQFRTIAQDVTRVSKERDDALEREALALETSRALDRLNAELNARLKEVEQLREELTEQSIKDHLTGIYNRRHFESRAIDLIDKANGKFSIALIDLDFFKRINDTFGHSVGDEVLIAFARLLDSHVRGGDFVARYGGEEFCVLLHRANAEQAAERLGALAKHYAELNIAAGEEMITGLTFSGGIVEFPLHGQAIDGLMSKADSALYRIKHNTRNAVGIAD